MIGAFYGLEKDTFTNTEDIWEGVFGLISSIIIRIMGAGLLRVNKMRKYAMFALPFITVLREELEAIVYVGGVGLGLPASSFPLAVFCGLLAGVAVGYIMYRGGSSASLQYFLIISTCFLYLVSAGLFSQAVGYFETNVCNQIIGGDASETGSSPGSYDIRKSGWGIFNALFGWTNSATYGSVLSYNLYWLCIILMYLVMRSQEQKGYISVVTVVIKKLGLDRFRKNGSSSASTAEDAEAVEQRKDVGGDIPVQVATRTLNEA
ncbi:iron permease FTR1 family-domain-containing protein [Aspergillus granulosus]|uniref:Iron permease FTR1 family-domain-containing protein n=1 Tax=Aspergillus granulosus TaxID=176169 RepID=A0ABR4HSY6_9EURO